MVFIVTLHNCLSLTSSSTSRGGGAVPCISAAQVFVPAIATRRAVSAARVLDAPVNVKQILQAYNVTVFKTMERLALCAKTPYMEHVMTCTFAIGYA